MLNRKNLTCRVICTNYVGETVDLERDNTHLLLGKLPSERQVSIVAAPIVEMCVPVVDLPQGVVVNGGADLNAPKKKEEKRSGADRLEAMVNERIGNGLDAEYQKLGPLKVIRLERAAARPTKAERIKYANSHTQEERDVKANITSVKKFMEAQIIKQRNKVLSGVHMYATIGLLLYIYLVV